MRLLLVPVQTAIVYWCSFASYFIFHNETNHVFRSVQLHAKVDESVLFVALSDALTLLYYKKGKLLIGPSIARSEI